MANFTLVFWTYKLGISFYFLVSSQFLLCPEVCTVYIFPSLVDTVRFLRLLRMELFVFPPLSMFAIGIQEGCWLLWINIISCYFAEWVHQMSEFSGGLFYVENHIIWKSSRDIPPIFFFRQHLTREPWMIWNSLWSWGWHVDLSFPEIHRDCPNALFDDIRHFVQVLSFCILFISFSCLI